MPKRWPIAGVALVLALAVVAIARAQVASPFGMSTEVPGSYDEVVQEVKQALAAEGFGVITEIDVKATMKKKLDLDFQPYLIMGACNPRLAHRALTAEPEVGLLLPCNVVVYQTDRGVKVSAIDPTQRLGESDNPELQAVSKEVRGKLARVIAQLGKQAR